MSKSGRIRSDCGDFGYGQMNVGIDDWDIVLVQIINTLKHAWQHNANVDIIINKY